ncbi:MAG: molybdopterin molybdenumtransferase MoeA, partial [Nitratireductor sp.]|nr:molybdopterin molybdenumtransferase MoeA [Nitratireductor sp.]
NGEREDYVRASATRRDNGKLVVEPLPVQDSSMLAFMARADVLLIRPVDAPPAAEGDACRVILLREI